MLKKFVPLNSNASPSQNPYEVRTFLGDNTRPEWKPELCKTTRTCDQSNSTISQVMTLEDELRRIHERTKESRFQRPFKKKCDKFDIYTECIKPQRTPKDLKRHARAREHFIRANINLLARVHDGTEVKPELLNLVQLESPMVDDDVGEEEEGERGEDESRSMQVRPRIASPSCSIDVIYKPPQRLLELRRPKSGIYINQSQRPELDDLDIPYSSYNPRLMQRCFDSQNLEKIDIIDGKGPDDLWTWNLSQQRPDAELDQEYKTAMITEFDCKNTELTLYDIPDDLHKTFGAEIVLGTTAIKPVVPSVKTAKKPSFYNRPLEMAAIYLTYADTFNLNPDFWQFDALDSLLVASDKLVARSATLNYKSPDTDYDILPQIADRQAVIGLKVHYTGPVREEPNIFKALSLFFSKFNACVLCSKNLYLLIWKRCLNSYYIFDPNGRTQFCQRDFEDGKCSLMSIRSIEHLVHLIMYFSDLDYDFDYNLYEIFIINYGKIMSPISSKPAPKRTHKLWAVVNSTFAIIPAANNGLQQPIGGADTNASMLISLLALLYSDIDRALLWRLEVVDDLVRFGQNFFKFFSTTLKLKKKQHMNIMDLPEALMMGAFRATLKKGPFFYTGHITNCANYKDSQLTLAMKELFTSEWESALLQVDNLVLAVWRDTEYYYLFDPFRRGKVGQVLDPEDFLTKGVACLQIHTDLEESFCRILYTKALNMRRGGKFFVHGVSVGCIKPLISEINYKSKYKNLLLTFPLMVDEPEPEEKATPKSKKAKAKKPKVERTYSIKSIPSQDFMPEYDSIDIVGHFLENLLCDVMENLPEHVLKRPSKYRKVAKVLLKTDKSYLKQLQYDLQHGVDYDNLDVAFRKYPEPAPQPMTLEEELNLPSNFTLLPDGTWVIFGNYLIPLAQDNESKLEGLLANIVAAALSAKYKISTWNDKLVDFAVNGAKNFGEQFQNYERTLELLLSKHMPNIGIGDYQFRVDVLKVFESTTLRPLRQLLLESLINHDRVLMICQRFSCLIIKRYNFLYVFVGYPCNAIGYRKFGPGPGCLLRIVELDSLIRRVEFGCNPQGCEVTNYVLVALNFHDVSKDPPERYKTWPALDEQDLYSSAANAKEKDRERHLGKVQFLDDELRKENARIDDFLTEKQWRLKQRKLELEKRCYPKRYWKNKALRAKLVSVGLEEAEEFEEEFEQEGEEEDDEIELKHKPGRKLRRMLPDEFKPRPILYGYRMREKDCLYKIQGSAALQARDMTTLQDIKTCYFSSVLAILYAIMRPLNQWSMQRVDRVLDGSKVIASKVANMRTAFERVIKNITVDDYEFDVWVKTYEPVGVYGAPLERKISKSLHLRRYLMIQNPNATYAIYRDDNYHLFDPYSTMEMLQPEEEGEGEKAEEADAASEKHSKCPKGIKRYSERNTASWVLFADLPSMVEYINKRTINTLWKEDEEYKLHVVDVLSYKKASPKTRMLQLLTDLSVPMECELSHHGEDESEVCAIAETVSWLDLENCLPVWSRMNRRNSSGRYRNLPVTKLKKFDIEIEGRLWSLWGTIHPSAPVFGIASRGRQFLACNVVACCTASVYHLTDWSSQLLDSIVISGDKYHRESLENIKRADYEFSLEDLGIECSLENIHFVVHIEHRVYGVLYCHPTRARMNLADALMYFFSHFQFGVLQCNGRSLAIGRTQGHDGGYFMFDSQSREHPLFPKGQGASYLLRTRHLQMLLYCIVISLNIPFFNIEFTIHQVAMLREGASLEDDEEEEDEGEGKKAAN